MATVHQFDAIVIGGGIFGCYAALFLASKGRRVALLEREPVLFGKASVVNQARLHSGYHYPRSIATALMSDEHKARFTEEHRRFVFGNFEKYYAIDRYGSFTDAGQFERFCQRLQIRCDRIEEHALFNFDRIEALYRTEEHTFDPILIREYYLEKVRQTPLIEVFTSTRILEAAADSDRWKVRVLPGERDAQTLDSPLVVNATYAATNAVNRLFGVPDIHLMHEISEIAFVYSPQLKNIGLTVMDGPFGSIMPYGLSGLLSLSSVAYTHHKVSYDNLPAFDCQDNPAAACTPQNPRICTHCPAQPATHARMMMGQMLRYFHPQTEMTHLFSYYTIKSKLKASHIDDSRPTEISCLHQKPWYYCLFAGKINSIYEVEKIDYASA